MLIEAWNTILKGQGSDSRIYEAIKEVYDNNGGQGVNLSLSDFVKSINYPIYRRFVDKDNQAMSTDTANIVINWLIAQFKEYEKNDPNSTSVTVRLDGRDVNANAVFNADGTLKTRADGTPSAGSEGSSGGFVTVALVAAALLVLVLVLRR